MISSQTLALSLVSWIDKLKYFSNISDALLVMCAFGVS